MNTQTAISLQRCFALIALTTALLNAYHAWFKDNCVSSLLILTLAFAIIAVTFAEYAKRKQQKPTERHTE